jgi:Mn2+/Fe2+ NRAMP family transporter
LAVSLLLVANVINLGADLSAMGAALQLLVGGSIGLYTLLFGLVCAGLEIFLPYRRYSAVLKWSTLSLYAYLGVLVVAGVQWREALTSLVVPDIQWTAAYATGFVAILGTTISPYLFFWQAAQEVEEEKRSHAKPLYVAPANAGTELRRIREDTLIGMAFSTLVSLAIMFATAATLHKSGITNIESAAQAAEALRPLAGSLASVLFAAGIVGTGMLAVPVLAGSAAYALTEMVGLAGSLSSKPLRARFFYGVILATTIAGASFNEIGINPIKALYWAAVVNGVLAVPLMAIMMLIVRNPAAMGSLVLPPRLTAIGWAATAVMAFATVLFFVSLG